MSVSAGHETLIMYNKDCEALHQTFHKLLKGTN